ncbi:MAG: gliding motility-associated C-terminal domain-containing protein [Saprospiraceae bacterium]|nr:gliding motility-associated C-terminal domain-containing protein [Saprospiraceae bacterium]
MYTDVLQSAFGGCDSTVTTQLTVNPSYQINQTLVICEGESIVVGGNTYTTSGNYADDLFSVNGCDSIVTTALTVVSSLSVTQSFTFCEGESVTVGTQVYTQTGNYLDTLQSAAGNGCDSIVTTSIVVYPATVTQQNLSVCEGESITVGNNQYNQTGSYTDNLQTLNGCDSTVLTNLTVLAGVSAQAADLAICAGQSSQLLAQGAQQYVWSPADGLSATNIADPIATPSQTTTYTVTGTSQTSNLIFNGDFELGNTGFSSNYTYSHNDVGPQAMYDITDNAMNAHPLAAPCTDHTSGTGNFMVVNGAGIPNTTVWQQTVAVQPQTDYIFSAWVTNWSSIQFNLSNLQFSVNGQLLGNVFQPLPQQCQWQQFYIVWNSGNANTAVIRLVNQNLVVGGNDFGLDDIHFSRICTSTAIVEVIVSQPVVQVISPTICQGETFTVGNTQYSQSGSYSNTFPNLNGCDSTVLTDLTVLPVFQTTQALVLCEGESIIVGNHVYTQPGIFVDSLNTLAGCDSIVTTSITLHPLAFTQQGFSICQGESIVVGNNTYTLSGNYVDILQTWQGCDSTVTTSITVLPVTTTVQEFTLCEGESIVVGSNTYSVNGNYADTLQTWQGCDSTVLTSLTVLPTYFQTLDVTVCEGESYVLGNQAYSQTGNYIANLQSALGGCDSIVQLALTVTALDADLSAASPLCFGDENGSLSITQVTGGIEPYIFSINDTAYFSPNTTYPNLPGGDYLLWIEDANGCRKAIPFSLDEPNELQFSLPELLQIDLGNNAQLLPTLNFFPDSIAWSPAEGLSCADCLEPHASPNVTTTYYLWAQDENGCPVEGQIQVVVKKDRNIYAPNVFSPNGDGINDNFLLFSGSSVEAIRRLLIFDRWGGIVFEGAYLTLNEPAHGWDGTHRGLPVNSGVFAWFAEVEFVDGEVEVLKGDVTVVR